MGMVIAGADFGSNKTGFIAVEAKGGTFEQLARESRFTRLAEGLNESGRIHGEAVVRTLLWCEEMRKRFKKLGVARFRGVGTEALRRASNQKEVLGLIEDVLGWPIEVITGEEEAARPVQPAGTFALINAAAKANRFAACRRKLAREIDRMHRGRDRRVHPALKQQFREDRHRGCRDDGGDAKHREQLGQRVTVV